MVILIQVNAAELGLETCERHLVITETPLVVYKLRKFTDTENIRLKNEHKTSSYHVERSIEQRTFFPGVYVNSSIVTGLIVQFRLRGSVS